MTATPLLIHSMRSPRLAGSVDVPAAAVTSEPRVWVDALELAAWCRENDYGDLAAMLEDCVEREEASS